MLVEDVQHDTGASGPVVGRSIAVRKVPGVSRRMRRAKMILIAAHEVQSDAVGEGSGEDVDG
jgi:hypothetical protein